MAAAANVQLSLTGYALFLVLTVTVCVLFQEQFVVRVRKRLVARFIPPCRSACRQNSGETQRILIAHAKSREGGTENPTGRRDA